MKKLMMLLIVLCLAGGMTGCVYSHNYDRNGNEMSEEEVKERIASILDGIGDTIFP